MKGELKLAVLLLIQGGALATREILDALHYISYNESYRRLRGLRARTPKHPILDRILENDITAELTSPNRAVHNTLYKLKREKFIAQDGQSGWTTTRKGKALAARILKTFLPRPRYPKESSDDLKIIVFDIPERLRRKRQWLRLALIALGFHLLQKSVWIGKQVLPEDFIRDLGTMGILEYVHIFAVTKRGTLRELS